MDIFDKIEELENLGVSNPYLRLGVRENATREEILKTYREAIQTIGINNHVDNNYVIQILTAAKDALLNQSVRDEIDRRIACQKQERNVAFSKSKLLKSERLIYKKVDDFGFWGVSLTGKKHKEAGKPCQDANYVRLVNAANHPTIIAAIADGVGSCTLSHYGSSIAVHTVIDYLTQVFNKLDISETPDKDIGEYIRTAMQYALDAVNEEAKLSNQLPYSYQSTLTTALYDGKELYFGHVGDDGIVVLTNSGKLSLITSRIKGEEASSVFPLQAGRDCWEVGKCAEPVDGFMMATDGVLDTVVMSKADNNRVYYPFMQPAFTETNDILGTGNLYINQLFNTPELRDRITDDITVVFAINDRIKNNPYTFDIDQWNRETDHRIESIDKALYGKPYIK